MAGGAVGLLLAVCAAAALAATNSAAPVAGMSNRECLSCHGLAALKNAAAATIYVDPGLFGRSIHGRIACARCHAALTRYPHGVVAPVHCAQCHETERRYEGIFHQSSLIGAALLRARDGSYVLAERAAPAPATPDAACRACHEAQTVSGSIHAGRRCVECHPDATPNHGPLGPPQCGRCHVDEAGNYSRTIHGLKQAGGDTRAPDCSSCHGGHAMRHVTDPASPVHPANISATCLHCHGAAAFAQARGIRVTITPDSYAASVHGRPAPEHDLAVAATCVDCHGAHMIMPIGNPESQVNFRSLVRTCGRCHVREAAEYAASAHGRANAAGANDAPTCSGCHGEHAVLSHLDSRSASYRLTVAQKLCLGCHDQPALNAKYDLQGGRGATYLDSYHGLATRGRSTTAAVCTDCHGIHLILGEADPASTINPARRTATCGRCHADADARFAAAGAIHVTYGDHWLTNLIRWAYRFIIAGTLGGMLVWVLLLVFMHMRRRLAASLDNAPRRFTPTEIFQHALLLLTFIVLAITGFALAFPDAGWAQFLAQIGLLTEDRRGMIHRVAGMIMVLTGLAHVGYLLLTRRGRWLLARLRPQWFDVRTTLQHLLHALGLRRAAPHFRHFSYFEKAEYWALIWGSVIMAATGFILWFPEQLPRLLVQVSEAVHFYEAILAAGAILVWHLFFVFLDHEIFPLNPSMFTGRAPRGSELAERTESGPGPAASAREK